MPLAPNWCPEPSFMLFITTRQRSLAFQLLLQERLTERLELMTFNIKVNSSTTWATITALFTLIEQLLSNWMFPLTSCGLINRCSFAFCGMEYFRQRPNIEMDSCGRNRTHPYLCPNKPLWPHNQEWKQVWLRKHFETIIEEPCQELLQFCRVSKVRYFSNSSQHLFAISDQYEKVSHTAKVYRTVEPSAQGFISSGIGATN